MAKHRQKKGQNPSQEKPAEQSENRRGEDRGFDGDFFSDGSIDLTADGSESSDSDLDINALLRKYMPEYREDGDKTDEEPGEASAEPQPEQDEIPDEALAAFFAESASDTGDGEASGEKAAAESSGLLSRFMEEFDREEAEESAPAEEAPGDGLLSRIRRSASEDSDDILPEVLVGDEEEKEKSGGLFSRMKKTVEEEDRRQRAESADSELLNALDTAFVLPENDGSDFSAPASSVSAEDAIQEYELNEEAPNGTAAPKAEEAFSDDPIDFGGTEPVPPEPEKKPVGEEIADERVEALFDDVKPKKKRFSLFRRKEKKKEAVDFDEELIAEEGETFPAPAAAVETPAEEDDTDALIAEAAAAMFGRSKRAEKKAQEAAEEAEKEARKAEDELEAAALAALESSRKTAETVETAAAESAETVENAAEASVETVAEAAEEAVDPLKKQAEEATVDSTAMKQPELPFVKQSKRSASNISDEELLRWAAETLAEDDFAPGTPNPAPAAAAPAVTADSPVSQLESLLGKSAMAAAAAEIESREEHSGSEAEADVPAVPAGSSEKEEDGKEEKTVGWQTPDQPYEDEEFDPTDINLMVAFGLDAGENKKADHAKQFGDKLEHKQQTRDTAIKLDRAEFVDKSQIPEIRKEYGRRSLSLFVRMILCFVFTVLLFLFENIETVTRLITGTGMQFGGVLDPSVYPAVYSMVSLQIMLLACLCAYDELAEGIKSIFRGSPRPESMTVLLAAAGILYSAVVARITVSPNEPKMFNFLVALSAFMTIIYSIFNNKREMMNFRIVSSKKPKHIVRRLRDDESENEAKAFSDAEDVCDVMKIEKTDFIDGFFARLKRPDSTTGVFMMFVMGAAAVLAVIFGVIARIRGGDGTTVARAMYESLLMMAPFSVFIMFSYPFYRANVTAKDYDSAIIGETSLEEYSNASVISFDDKNVFPSYFVKVQNIRIYNNARIDRVLYYASSVFAYAGGPLQDVFEVATKDLGNSSNVKIYDTEDNFLATQVDGVNIIFGSCDALRDRGFDIPEDAVEDDVDLSDELSIMYMFRENKLVAKMYVKYEMDSDMDLILKQFSGNGLYACVRTFDPNIDEAMIAKKLSIKKMPLKIVRYADLDEVMPYEAKADSGLVTCGSQKSLLQVISYCGKVLRTKKTHAALTVMSILVSAAIMTILLFANLLGGLTPLTITLYQLAWLVPVLITSRVFIR